MRLCPSLGVWHVVGAQQNSFPSSTLPRCWCFALKHCAVMLKGEPLSSSLVKHSAFLTGEFRRLTPHACPAGACLSWRPGFQVPSPLGSLPTAPPVVSRASRKMSPVEGQSGCAYGKEDQQSPGWAWHIGNFSSTVGSPCRPRPFSQD